MTNGRGTRIQTEFKTEDGDDYGRLPKKYRHFAIEKGIEAPEELGKNGPRARLSVVWLTIFIIPSSIAV